MGVIWFYIVSYHTMQHQYIGHFAPQCINNTYNNDNTLYMTNYKKII